MFRYLGTYLNRSERAGIIHHASCTSEALLAFTKSPRRRVVSETQLPASVILGN